MKKCPKRPKPAPKWWKESFNSKDYTEKLDIPNKDETNALAVTEQNGNELLQSNSSDKITSLSQVPVEELKAILKKVL